MSTVWIDQVAGLSPARVSFLRALGLPCQFLPIHAWFLVLAALDVALTSVILTLGGDEANGIARAVIEMGGLSAMVLFKLTCVVIALVLCELVGHRRHGAGRAIALAAVALNTIAVCLGVAYLAIFSTTIWLAA